MRHRKRKKILKKRLLKNKVFSFVINGNITDTVSNIKSISSFFQKLVGSYKKKGYSKRKNFIIRCFANSSVFKDNFFGFLDNGYRLVKKKIGIREGDKAKISLLYFSKFS